jgi:hypothetical protein
MESGNIDTDTWNGTLDELKAFVGQRPAPVEMDDHTLIQQLYKLHPELWEAK